MKPYTEQDLANFRKVQVKIAKEMSDYGISPREIAKELKVSEEYIKELLAHKS